jgi:hypothetical protein
MLTTLLLTIAIAIELTWTDNSANEDGFKLYRQPPGGAFVLIATTPANIQKVADLEAAPGACYKLTAFNLAGESEFSNTVCLPLLPAPPSNLQAKPVR